MPKGNSSMLSTVGCVTDVLAGDGSDQECVVCVRNSVREVRWLDSAILQATRVGEINRDVGQYIVRIPDLCWLIDEQQIRLIVPGPKKETAEGLAMC